jgi:hypothetical protein
LAPAFFIRLAADSSPLFESLAEHAPEIVVIDLDTIVPRGNDVFAHIESVYAGEPLQAVNVGPQDMHPGTQCGGLPSAPSVIGTTWFLHHSLLVQFSSTT